MRWMRWFCLPLAFKFWHGGLLLDSPTHDQACTRRTYFLPRSFHSCSMAAVCLSPHTNVAQNVYFRAQGLGRRRRTFHISVYQAICVRLCKCASPDPSNSVDIWSPLRLWSAALSFTPVHVRGGRFWLPKHMMICELWHWNSSHIHTLTPLKVIVGFFFTRHCRKWERRKMCTFLLLHNQSRKVAAVSSIFLYSFNIYCCFSGWATHTSNHKHWCQLL